MGARILVIEDHPANMQLMEFLLRAFGHTVAGAETGELGVVAARRDQPDLIICDVQLPAMDGHEVVRTLKTGNPPVAAPVIAVTAFAMAGDRQRLLASGFDGYIAKPIAPETFVSEIEGFLPDHLHGQMAPAFAPGGRRAEPAPGGRRLHILAVDDSRVNLGFLRSVLEPHGYDVTLADDVDAAMATAREHRPDLVLSDVHMPGADGFTLLRRLRSNRRLRMVPFAFISSTMLGESDRQRATVAGANDFILRPIEPQVLLDRVAALLEGAPDGNDPRR